MADFWDAATTPIAIVFFVPLAVCLVLWLVSMLGFIDIDSDASEAFDFDGLDWLGLHGAPPLVVFTLVSLMGWFTAVVAALFVLDPLGGLGLLLGSAAVFVVALGVGLFVGSKVAPPLGRLLATATAPRAADLVGALAVVRSGRVDASFGYADARWADGSESRIDIRDTADLGLVPGDKIRLMSFDANTGTYGVALDSELFGQ
jgi:hypothetical protein